MISTVVMQWISSYGYLGLAALLMLGIAGIPVPDETLLTFAGYLVYKGQLQLIPTVVSASWVVSSARTGKSPLPSFNGTSFW